MVVFFLSKVKNEFMRIRFLNNNFKLKKSLDYSFFHLPSKISKSINLVNMYYDVNMPTGADSIEIKKASKVKIKYYITEKQNLNLSSFN